MVMILVTCSVCSYLLQSGAQWGHSSPRLSLPANTPCLKKTVPVLFLNNSVKHWPTLIIFGIQHREDT